MWRHLGKLSLNPTNSVNATKKSSPFPRIPEKAMGRIVFDRAWVTCPPINQSNGSGRWSSLNGQAQVIHQPPGIGPTYLTCSVRWGVPEGKLWALYRTWEDGDLAHSSSHGFKAYAILVILSLCVRWYVSFLVWCSGVQFRE